DAAAVGDDGVEDQLQDALQELVEVEDVADGLGGLVQDGQVGQADAQPGRVGQGGPGQDAAGLGLADRLDDGAGALQVLLGQQPDLVGEVDRRRPVGPAGAVDQDGLADLDVVAGLEQDLLHRLGVDVGAVGAADVDQAVALVGEAQLGVAARDLGVVQVDGIALAAADAEGGAGQLELLPFVNAFDDDQTRHGTIPGNCERPPGGGRAQRKVPPGGGWCQGKAPSGG